MKKQFFLATLVAMATVFISQKMNAQASQPKPLDMAAKNAVISSLLLQMDEKYIFPKTAKAAAVKIMEYQKKGIYNMTTDPKEFAKLLTEQLRDLVKDKHLSVWYNPDQKPKDVLKDETVEKERESKFLRYMGRQNFGLPKLDILEGNVGYLKIDGFGPVDKVGETVTGAMMYLANTEALIIDLRDNGGGEPDLVRYVASYFFGDTPVHINDLYYRKDNKNTEYWTIPVPGKKYLAKPVYVLTSGRTFSGGEELAYDLQTQERATLIGETTGGGANPGDMADLGNGFFAFIPDGRAINPITKTNWEGVGVIPDVAINESSALRLAHLMALQKLWETAPDDMSRDFHKKSLEAVQQ